MNKQKNRILQSRRTGAVLVAAAVVTAIAVGTTHANFGSQGDVGASGTTNGVFIADGVNHIVLRIDLDEEYDSGVTLTLGFDYDTTDLNTDTWEEDYCPDDWYHDVCVYDGNYHDNGFWGWNACDDWTEGSHPNMICHHNVTRFNHYYESEPNYDYQHIACHELGHTVGLRHDWRTSSCMNGNGVYSNTLSSHDKNHINGYY